MKTEENFGVYIPPVVHEFTYPQVQDQHMMHVTEKYHPVIDQNYTYRDTSFKWKFKHFLFNIFLHSLVIPVAVVRYAVKVDGRKNLRKNRSLLKNGFVTVSNHVIEWDFLALLYAMRPRNAYFPIWARNMETPLAPVFKTIGGIAVPPDARGGRKFLQAMNSVLEDKKWLHVFAEGSMWYFYPAVRNFKTGASTFAVKHNVPLIPLAVSYRKPTGIYALFKKYPNLTVHIGEPLFADESLSTKQAEKDLTLRARQSVMHMMGIKDEEENLKIMQSL